MLDYEAHTRPPTPADDPDLPFVEARYYPLIAVAAVLAGIVVSYFFPLGFAAP